MLNFAARAIAENNAAALENFQSIDPEQTSELLTSLRWWRQGLEHHRSEQTRWQPLLTLKGWSQGGSSLQWDGEETALYVVYGQLTWTEQAAFVTIRHP
ncbi:MAG: hypothetical protein AB7S38_29675 [Vulcanimicrobiota bacterium]